MTKANNKNPLKERYTSILLVLGVLVVLSMIALTSIILFGMIEETAEENNDAKHETCQEEFGSNSEWIHESFYQDSEVYIICETNEGLEVTYYDTIQPIINNL